MFGKYNGFVSKARVSACMYFLVLEIISTFFSYFMQIIIDVTEQTTHLEDKIIKKFKKTLTRPESVSLLSWRMGI